MEEEGQGMYERFNDGRRAGAYVFSGILTDLPAETFQLEYRQRKQHRIHECKASELGHLLVDYCAKFPMASAYYTPESKDGVIAQIRCHCSHEGSAWCCKTGGHHHAKVLVRLVKQPAIATEMTA